MNFKNLLNIFIVHLVVILGNIYNTSKFLLLKCSKSYERFLKLVLNTLRVRLTVLKSVFSISKNTY